MSGKRGRYHSQHMSDDGDDFASSSSSSSSTSLPVFQSTTVETPIPSIFGLNPSIEMKISQVSLTPINFIPSGTLLPEYRSHSVSTLSTSGLVLLGGDAFVTPSMFPPQSKNQCHLLQILDASSSSKVPSNMTSTFLTCPPFQSITGHSLHYMSTVVIGVETPLHKIFTCCGFINGNISNEIYLLELGMLLSSFSISNTIDYSHFHHHALTDVFLFLSSFSIDFFSSFSNVIFAHIH